MDSNQKDIEVVFVLPMLATLCTNKEQESNSQTKVAELYSQEKLVLSQRYRHDVGATLPLPEA